LTIESVAARQILLSSGRFQAVISRRAQMSGDRQNEPEGNK
jgi:hypothetical protein